MGREESAFWGVRRPVARLWMTLGLGLLGAALLGCEQRFAPHAFANIKSGSLALWLLAAFAGALWLRRGAPAGDYAVMALALLLALVLPLDRLAAGDGYGGFGYFCLVVLVLVGGASCVRLRLRGETGFWWRLAPLARGLAIALAAPFLLFAARPGEPRHDATPESELSWIAFGAFPCLLAGGFLLPHVFGGAPGFALAWLSFSFWAWLGAALLLLLDAWPEQPQFSGARTLSPARKAFSLTAVATVLAFLVFLLALDECLFLLFFHPLFVWQGLGCLLACWLLPSPGYPAVAPRLEALPPGRRASFWTLAALLAMGVAVLWGFPFQSLGEVFGGHLFTTTFDPFHGDRVSSALDQSSLKKCFFIFAYYCFLVCPLVASARWLADRTKRRDYWALVLFSTVFCLVLCSLLTGPCYWLLQYVHFMGWTPRRLAGVLCSGGGYIALAGFWLWVVWPPPPAPSAASLTARHA